ncbi:hypothetical protein PVAP13_2NG169603 [Panicum virgatum]|uniref:Uncharacterized protein n=1 Tax=Panicum virgatum TaxID=38727 RepID=A0A8T0VPC7_PANVG|nr:hypothetical protein PVAP13_2NG169603 [Panicum virgatum]
MEAEEKYAEEKAYLARKLQLKMASRLTSDPCTPSPRSRPPVARPPVVRPRRRGRRALVPAPPRARWRRTLSSARRGGERPVAGGRSGGERVSKRRQECAWGRRAARGSGVGGSPAMGLSSLAVAGTAGWTRVTSSLAAAPSHAPRLPRARPEQRGSSAQGGPAELPLVPELPQRTSGATVAGGLCGQRRALGGPARRSKGGRPASVEQGRPAV